MNGSIQCDAMSCQLPSQTTTSSSREAATCQRNRRRRRRTTGATAGAVTSTPGTSSGAVGTVTAVASREGVEARAVSGGTGGSAGAGELDLDAEGVPDRAVQLDELGGQSDLLDLARALEVHRNTGLHRC